MLKRSMSVLASVALLALSCTPRAAQTSQTDAGLGAGEPPIAQGLGTSFNPWDSETQEALKAGVTAFGQRAHRFVEIDMSSRIDRRAARSLYESFRARYRPGLSCHVMSSDELRVVADQNADSPWPNLGPEAPSGSSAALPRTIPAEALHPLLRDTQMWLEALEQARPDLVISVNRLCLYLLNKDEIFVARGVWHTDVVGQITALWTIYGQPTWYTEGSLEPEAPEDIRIPSFGRLLMLKSQGHPDLKELKAKAVLHTTPPKPGDRLTFVVFFGVTPRRKSEAK